MTPYVESLVAIVVAGLVVGGAAAYWWRVRACSALTVFALVLPAALVVLTSGTSALLPYAQLPVRVQSRAPILLPLLAAGWLVVSRGRDLEARLSPLRARLHAVLAGLALAVCALWLGEAEGLTWNDDQARIVVWDVSRSATRAGVTSLRRDAELRLAEQSMQPGDRLGVVEVAGRAELTVPLHEKGRPSARLDVDLAVDATDLEAGVRRALAELPADAAAKIVLVSDGVENRGDVLRAVTAARTRGIAVDALAIEYAPPEDVELHAVRAPSRAAAGQPFDLRVETASPRGEGPIDAELGIERDGVPWQTRAVRLARGHDVLQVPLEEAEAGFHRYSVTLRGAHDGIRENDQQTTFVDVHGARTALVLSGIVPAPSPLDGILRDAGFQVKHAAARDVVDDVADFLGHDLVVIEDVPAAALGPTRLRSLAQAVAEVGTGLLLVGGRHAFGPGGYAGSALETASPVSFDLKKDKSRPPLAEIILIDYSGSMSATVGRDTKIALANEAAARSAALLSPGDRLGVAHVDTEVRWTVPLASIADGKSLAPQIRSVQAGGGGIYTQVALEAAYGALRAVPAGTLKHVLLFADGDDAEEILRCPALAAAARADDVTTSVVSLGRGSDSTMLERTSSSGGGRFYLVEDARTLPEVFSQETVLASRRAFREEHVVPKAQGESPLLRNVEALPALDGYVVTTRKPGARVSLVGLEDEPLVADWSYGLGKVGAMTTDLAGLWSAAWLSSEDAVRLTGQLATALARGSAPRGARIVASARHGELLLEASDALGVADADGSLLSARIVGPDGSTRHVALEEVGRGAFEGHAPVDTAGTHVVTLVRRTSADREGARAVGATDVLLGRTAVVTGSSDELAARASNRALLERIAAESGGITRSTLEGIFSGPRRWHATRSDLTALLAPFLAALIVGLVAVRRLVLPSRTLRVAASDPAPTRAEASALALARRAKATRAASEPTAPVLATRAASTAPPGEPRPSPPPAAGDARALTAVERIAQRRRDGR